MNELLLQYIWQHQLFNKDSLTTTSGQKLEILNKGTHNFNQGPDFLNGCIRIDGHTTWVGNIELHIRGSDWNRHEHTTDRNYDNVILHVVWTHDNSIDREIPTLELQDRISLTGIHRHRDMVRRNHFIPCEGILRQAAPDLIEQALKDMLSRRLNRKAERVQALLECNGRHWEEVQWWMLAKSFGGPVNGEAFESIARSIPYSVLARHRSQIHQLESLLLGQGNLLEADFTDQYAILLQKEYRFLKTKYRLPVIRESLYFLRMRPPNFPTVRLAQLAMLMHQHAHLFTNLIQLEELKEINALLQVTANDYWHYHFRLDETTGYNPKTTGQAFIETLILNAVIPVVYCYGKEQNELRLLNRVHCWLNGLPAEKNKITNGFGAIGLLARHAAESQALLELKQSLCDQKGCLHCAIGKHLLAI